MAMTNCNKKRPKLYVYPKLSAISMHREQPHLKSSDYSQGSDLGICYHNLFGSRCWCFSILQNIVETSLYYSKKQIKIEQDTLTCVCFCFSSGSLLLLLLLYIQERQKEFVQTPRRLEDKALQDRHCNCIRDNKRSLYRLLFLTCFGASSFPP